MLFVKEINGLRFEWQGGGSIDILTRVKPYRTADMARWINNATMRPEGWYYTNVNINVWNYDTDKPKIPVTEEAFLKTVNKWFAEK